MLYIFYFKSSEYMQHWYDQKCLTNWHWISDVSLLLPFYLCLYLKNLNVGILITFLKSNWSWYHALCGLHALWHMVPAGGREEGKFKVYILSPFLLSFHPGHSSCLKDFHNYSCSFWALVPALPLSPSGLKEGIVLHCYYPASSIGSSFPAPL